MLRDSNFAYFLSTSPLPSSSLSQCLSSSRQCAHGNLHGNLFLCNSPISVYLWYISSRRARARLTVSGHYGILRIRRAWPHTKWRQLSWAELLAYFALYLAAYQSILINFYESTAHAHTHTRTQLLKVSMRRMCNISFRSLATSSWMWLWMWMRSWRWQPPLCFYLARFFWVLEIYCLLQR